MPSNKNIVIIGNGIAGITAARHIRKWSDHKITVISAESPYFFSRTALMYVYMGHMKKEHLKPYEDWFWKKNRIDLMQAYVEELRASSKQLRLSTGELISFDILIIATGSVPNKFGWPGQDLQGVQGLYSMQDLDTMEAWRTLTRHAVIVGGGLIGIEMAEMLAYRKIPVSFLVREKSYWDNVLPWEESQMVTRHIKEHHIGLQLETELKEIKGDSDGKVKAAVTSKGEEIACEFVGLTAGVKPNIGFLQDSGVALERGVIVDRYFQTNVEDVYAIGDCAQFSDPPPGRKAIEQIWYTGRMHGETLAYSLCQKKVPYQPGVFFNSAKFLDVEYQVYGEILPAYQEKDDYSTVYWEKSGAHKSIRIAFNAKEEVIGFNLMGIRYRHEVCDLWIKEKKDLGYVLDHLKEANFDPEFFSKHEKEAKTALSRYKLAKN